MTDNIKIINNIINNEDKVFIIAELSANHNGSLKIAKDTIKAAKKAGADAIKFQTYTADTLTIDCDNEYFKIKEGLWKGKTLYELYQEAYTPWEWHEELFQVAKEEELVCFSSPFDKTAIDFLEELDTPAYKIASFEITDIPLIEYAASKGKPMIISTGIATEEDIELALETCYNAGNRNITLLKCTSQYPANIDQANLITIPDMKKKFNVDVGVSDHTLGSIVPMIAVSLGATIIEKHFILDRKLGGVDSVFSMEPHEFKKMIDSVRQAETSLGKVTYEVTEKDQDRRRSLFIVKDIKAGEIITEENVRSIRPGYGMHPKFLKEILGKKVNNYIEKGTPFKFSLID